MKDDRIEAIDQSGLKLSISAFGQTKPRARVSQGTVSRVYGKRQPAPVAVFEARGERSQEFMSFILPLTAKNQSARVEQQKTDVARAGAFTVSFDGSYDIVVTGNGINPVECKRLSAIASMAWARFVGSRLTRACFVRGKSIEIKDGISLRSPRVVKNCVIQLDNDRVEVSIEGTTRFVLSTSEPTGKVVINGTTIALKPDQICSTFNHTDAGWELVESDS